MGGSQRGCALTPPMTPLRLIKIWSPVAPSFAGLFTPCGLHAGLCHAFLVCLFCRAFAARCPCCSWRMSCTRTSTCLPERVSILQTCVFSGITAPKEVLTLVWDDTTHWSANVYTCKAPSTPATMSKWRCRSNTKLCCLLLRQCCRTVLGNNVEATFDFVEATFDFVERTTF